VAPECGQSAAEQYDWIAASKTFLEINMNKFLLSIIVLRARIACLAVLALAAGGLSLPATSADYTQTNLVSNLPGLATITDPLLVNGWGIARSPTSPFWTSNQNTNTATLYAVTGSTNVSQVTSVNAAGFVGIPTTALGPQGPTGQVNNGNTASFQLTPGTPTTSARFIFADLNGTVSGWAGGLTSTVMASTPGAVYTGLAINNAGTLLYAANNAGGTINVFNSSFAPVSLAGAFTDPNLPAGFVPFNVQNINGNIYVSYAPEGRPAQTAAAPGQGFVDIFNENGVFLQRLITASQLAAPWGMALAPAGFGVFGGDLLVGNFSFLNSGINAFDPVTGAFRGTIPINVGAGNTAGGLWALIFGSGAGNGGDANTLYFTDGITGETAGLFGAITVSVPEPGMLPLLAVGLAFLGLMRRKSRLSREDVNPDVAPRGY
jgi:uncharacterized protein (TIGR03118 family)